MHASELMNTVYRVIYVQLRFSVVNSSLPEQNGRHFAGYIFKCILINEKLCILIQSSLKIVLKGPIANKSALVQVVARRRTCDKPLPEPMLTQFLDALGKGIS